MCKQTICPQCVGAKEIMQFKQNDRGFEYVTCKLCRGTGIVNTELEEDFKLFINEDNFYDES